LTFVSKLPPKVGLDMFLSIVTYSISEGVPLPQAVTPLFGEPESYEYVEKPKFQGDVAAKTEAMRMIQESKLGEPVPVPFVDDPLSSDPEQKTENTDINIPETVISEDQVRS